jgi:beta-glucuronidase
MMHRLTTALCLLLVAGPAHGQSDPLITNVRARRITSLNGAWQTIIDPYEAGYYNIRHQPRSDGGIAANRKPRDRSDLVEYDFDTAGRLLVPGDWNSQRDELFFYEGTIWYKRDFDYDLGPGRRLFVYFGAANHDVVAWLNGHKLGEHEGGFTPFNFEITDYVRDTGNFLILKVDNQRRREAVPALNTDWWNYGGLTRDVFLIDVPGTFVRDYFIQLDRDAPDQLAGWVQLDGPQLRQRVRLGIPDAGVEAAVETDASGYATFRVDADLERWSPDDPKLYEVEVASETDRVSERIGFRTIETRGHDLLLNGVPIWLRGICIHEQAPLRDGRAFSEEDARTLCWSGPRFRSTG